ncbi:MAG TPA: nucleotide sugar dehydrogenase [Rhodospirillaceae bacterium]|nr:MAG: UDP-N-acetyl-D-galactosamine dehydrogenase [Alphaproteobacteria bacterium GWF2_58_20]HAU29123.1 nucleotide sugar dehydrogenase [Rhodospirillaceae bacterium]
MENKPEIAVVGLGYVGLPLAVCLARKYRVVGFDIASDRIAEIREGHDRTLEVPDDVMKASSLEVSDKTEDMKGAGIYIVTVPTPIDAANQPDLFPVRAASETVGRVLEKGAIVVYESTVYPGVTEDICGPILEKESGLVCGQDFFLGYSPERINPGDREHTVERIAKVVAGQTPEVTARLGEMYGSVNGGNVFLARDIKTAEASKVIENAQRDINIAFINEITMIFGRLGISIHDVLAASGTKWNFLKFQPGLVGGHCIGVDPYYLSHCAEVLGVRPEVILAGRRINDNMANYVADRLVDDINKRMAPNAVPKVLVLGLTFKENVPDQRNTKVVDLIQRLRSHGCEVAVHDPMADAVLAKKAYGLDLLPSLEGACGFDCVLGAVAHDSYKTLTAVQLAGMMREGGLVADLKGMWRQLGMPVWTL